MNNGRQYNDVDLDIYHRMQLFTTQFECNLVFIYIDTKTINREVPSGL